MPWGEHGRSGLGAPASGQHAGLCSGPAHLSGGLGSRPAARLENSREEGGLIKTLHVFANMVRLATWLHSRGLGKEGRKGLWSKAWSSLCLERPSSTCSCSTPPWSVAHDLGVACPLLAPFGHPSDMLAAHLGAVGPPGGAGALIHLRPSKCPVSWVTQPKGWSGGLDLPPGEELEATYTLPPTKPEARGRSKAAREGGLEGRSKVPGLALILPGSLSC